LPKVARRVVHGPPARIAAGSQAMQGIARRFMQRRHSASRRVQSTFRFRRIGKHSSFFELSHFLTENRYPLFLKML
jgi:hypothetical protein